MEKEVEGGPIRVGGGGSGEWARIIVPLLVLVLLLLCAREGGAVQIFFEQSGGFAGMRFTAHVETADLPSQEAQKVSKLVEKADFFHLPEKIVSPHPQPDRYQYLISVQGKKESHTVRVSDDAVPGCLAPLVSWLQGVMQPQRKE